MHSILAEVWFGLLATLVAWWIANRIGVRWSHPVLNGVLLSVAMLVVFLKLADIPFTAYAHGGRVLQFMLGPAVVAMAVPVYQYRALLRKAWKPLAASIVTGCFVSIVSATGLMVLLEGEGILARSIAAKSVTAPIAIELSRSVNGEPSLTAAIVIITGILGAVIGVSVLRWCRITDSLSVGVSMGVAGHGIATASLTSDPTARMAASLGMVLDGVVTSLVLPFIVEWMAG